MNSAIFSFSVQSSLVGPFFNGQNPSTLNDNYRQGIYIGTGDQSNYLMAGISGANGSGNPGIRVLRENNNVVDLDLFYPVPGILDMSSIFIYLDVNRVTGTVSIRYATSQNITPVSVGAPIPITGALLSKISGGQAVALGLMAQSGGAGTFAAQYDYLNIVSAAPAVINPVPNQQVDINSAPKQISLSNVFSDDEGLANITLSITGNSNTALVTGAVISGNTLTLSFAPNTVGNSVIKLTATDSDGLTATDEFNVDVNGTVSPGVQSLLINTGGPAVTEGNWQADNYFTGGITYEDNSAPVAGTTDPAVYKDERYGDFSYAMPLPNGNYTVKLHFAEIYYTATGARVFNVNIENSQGVLNNYDIVAEAGANTAVVKQFNNIQVTDGNLNIAFVSVIDNAKISAIEIIPAGVLPNTAPVLVNPVADQQIAPGTVSKTINLAGVFNDDQGAANLTLSVTGNSNPSFITGSSFYLNNLTLVIAPDVVDSAVITVRATDAQGLFVDDSFKIAVTETVTPATHIRINSGGTSYIYQGATWSADQYYAGGSDYSDNSPIAGTENDQLYQQERFGVVSYAIPVPNGLYTVKLHFAEIYYTTTGSRVFNITVENGQAGRSNYDIVAAANGAFKAVVEQMDNISVSDGFLNISFTGIVDNAKISGIEVISSGTAVNTPPVVVSPIPNQNLTIGTTTKNISLIGVFNDNGGVAQLALTVSANSRPQLVTGAVINGTTLQLTIANTFVNDSARITIRATDTAGLFIEDQFTVIIVDSAAPSFAVRINSGGGGYVHESTTWVADQYFTGGSTYADSPPIAGTTNDALHHDERYGNMIYSIPVPNGSYLVKLHFAEIFFTTPGARIFNVVVENGQGVLNNYDIVQRAGGGNTAVVEQFAGVSVSDGFLNINLTGVLDNAKISGIEIISTSGTPVNTAPYVVTPLADQRVSNTTTSLSFNLSNVFNDDAGQPALILSVSGNSKPSFITSAVITGSQLTLTLVSGTTDSALIKIKATDAQGLFVEDEFKIVSENQSVPAAAIRINSGGTAYSFEGENWSADQYFTGGSTYADNPAIAGTTNDVLHHTERYGAMSYAVPVSQGSYTVKLHFAEIYFTTPGARRFNVNVENGQGQLTNFDIVADAGSGNAATIKTFQHIAVADGFLNIAFTNVLDNAKVSGIEIISDADTVNTAPVVVVPIPDQNIVLGTASKQISLASTFSDDDGAGNITRTVQNNTNTTLVNSAAITGTNLNLGFASGITGTASITIRATDSIGQFVDDLFVVTVAAAPPTPTTVIRIASGGPGHSNSGETWMADQYFTDGNAYGEAMPIANTTNDQLYQNERWGDLGYQIPVPNGLYTVKLHFAEIYWTTPGNRVFNVNVENGQGQLNNYDIVARSGAGATAVVETFTLVNVTDGMMTITLNSVTDNAKISGIEVLSDQTSGGSLRMMSNNFEVRLVKEQVEITWSAETAGQYDIERSGDGRNFEIIHSKTL